MDISLFRIVTDGLREIQTNFFPIILFWFILIGLGQWGKNLLADQVLSSWGVFGLVAGWGCAWLSFSSLGFLLLGRMWPGFYAIGRLIILGLASLGILHGASRWQFRYLGSTRLILPLAFIASLFLVRMAFLHGLLMPPYNDSPEHYSLVGSLLRANEDLTRNYYHLGFHAISAIIISLTGSSIASTMSLLGQSFLILVPFTVMGLLEMMTRDRNIAWFGAVLAGLGWSMPAFAANWGKYPALGAVAVLPALLAMVFVFCLDAGRPVLSWVFAVGALAGLALLHTRVLVVFILALVAWKLSARFSQYANRNLVLTLISTVLAAFPIWLLRGPFGQFYSSDRGLLLILVGLCLPFALHFYPQASITASFYLFFSWVALILPLPSVLHQYSRTVLDRTFIEISSFLPVSIQGAAGMAGITRAIKPPVIRRISYVVLAGLVLVNFSSHPGNAPDLCCNYVRAGDLQAIEWIRTETTSDSIVVISSFQSPNYRIGTDAGIWVEVLSGRSIRKRSYALDWSSEAALRTSCQDASGDVYIYVGSMPFSFKWAGMDQDDAFHLVFEQDGSRVYLIRVCQDIYP